VLKTIYFIIYGRLLNVLVYVAYVDGVKNPHFTGSEGDAAEQSLQFWPMGSILRQPFSVQKPCFWETELQVFGLVFYGLC
jgi:hypothetical protein